LVLAQHDPEFPTFFGQHFGVIVDQGYMSGGSGYILSRWDFIFSLLNLKIQILPIFLDRSDFVLAFSLNHDFCILYERFIFENLYFFHFQMKNKDIFINYVQAKS